jgi:hypothetical protein
VNCGDDSVQRSQHLIVERRTALFKLSVTVKPFEQGELHGTVTIRPE